MRGTGDGRRGGRLRAFLLPILSLAPCLLLAHPANVPSSLAKVATDGAFSLRVRFDAIAFATGASPKDADDAAMTALIDGPEETLRGALADAAGRFRRSLVVGKGGEIDRLDFPTVEAVRRFLAGDPNPRLPVMLEAIVRGHLPKGARTVAFRYPDTFGTVVQTVEFPYREPISEPVDPGATSTTLTIPTAEEVARLAASMAAPRPETKPPTKAAPKALPPVAVVPAKPLPSPSPAVERKEPIASKPSLPKAVPPPKRPEPTVPIPEVAPPPAETQEPPRATGAQVASYLRMGFTHILPEGLDHILFVLGLFLLGSNTKALLKQITAFTVAHSITLALATFGLVRLPGRIIEPVIALSIAFVAIENLLAKDVKPWRTAVVFAFGLVHGMGFAEVFADAGLSGRGLLTALLSFNVGVELGQLSVVAMALLAVGWFRKDARYRQVVVVPASLLIAAVALFWTVQRVLF